MGKNIRLVGQMCIMMIPMSPVMVRGEKNSHTRSNKQIIVSNNCSEYSSFLGLEYQSAMCRTILAPTYWVVGLLAHSWAFIPFPKIMTFINNSISYKTPNIFSKYQLSSMTGPMSRTLLSTLVT